MTLPIERDNPFWRFSLAVYERPGVAEHCIAVQDALGGDVNLLLYCVWTGRMHGQRLSEASIAELERVLSDWNAAAIHPLRSARSAIKTLPDCEDAAVAAFRKDVAALELGAEQIAQAKLHAQSPVAGEALQHGSAEIAAANAALYLRRLSDAREMPEPAASPEALLAAAEAYVASLKHRAPPHPGAP